MKLETAKGMKDYGPQEKALKNSIINTIQEVFELYGFNPLETPVMEKYDVLSGKYAGGSEILKETYKLTDQGDRQLGLRYDFTVPLARYIGSNPTVKLPFKRYQIGPVFRDGPVKTGRLRQFYQADADIIGTSSILADKQLLQMALDVFEKLGIQPEIKLNNRKVLNAVLEKAEVPPEQIEGAILSLDKLEKIGTGGVVDDMTERGLSEAKAYRILDIIKELEEKGAVFLEEEMPGEGSAEIKELIEMDSRIKFTPSLARGLSYYTGSIFEAYTQGFDGSIAAGGRYDEMIGKTAGRGDYSAIGISFGIEPLIEVLKGQAETQSIAKAFIIPIGKQTEAEALATKLRKDGINTDIDITGRGVSKGLDYANSYEIPYVILLGEKEVEQSKYTLKDMKSGEEKLLDYEELLNSVK